MTNVEEDARAFGRRLETDGLQGVVYGALTGDTRYLVTSEDDWAGLAALQWVTPVCLAAPHGKPQLVCVVGDQVVWDGDPAADSARLEPGLRRFAEAAGVAFIGLALAPTSNGLCVAEVETHPRLEGFGHAARNEIVEGIVELLTTEREGRVGSLTHRSARSGL